MSSDPLPPHLDAPPPPPAPRRTIALDPLDRRRRIKFENRIQLSAMLMGLPAVAIALTCLWTLDFSLNTRLTLTGLILVFWLGGGAMLKDSICYPLRTLSNLLGALGEGDYSLKGAAARNDDILGEVMREINALSDLLREHRLGAREEGALVQKLLAEIDVAVFAFDGAGRLRLVNRGGERLIALPAEAALGRDAASLALTPLLEGAGDQVIQLALPGGTGRWKIHRGHYREGGQPRRLVIMTDLTRTLRAEEREAWKRLIQILRHEINNSLAPISSIAGSLRQMRALDPRPADWESDLAQGLEVIESRSESLHRFILAYSEITRLPDPQRASVDLGALVRRAAGLDGRIAVEIIEGPELTIQADGDQLGQLLINLLRNAIEAAGEAGRVAIGWEAAADEIRVWVDDNGPGVADPEKAFTPFYTTKPQGAGIGLPLCRQIAENHGGSLTLETPPKAQGCRAILRLPRRE